MTATSCSAAEAAGGSSRSRSPTRPLSVSGTGSAPLPTRTTPRRARARPISSAMNGLPPQSSWIRRSTWCENELPSRVRSSRCSAPRLRPPTGSSSALSRARPSSSGSSAPGPATRCEHSRPMGSRSSRRKAKLTAASVGRSSHCTSSIQTSTGAKRAMASNAARKAAAIACGSGSGVPGGGSWTSSAISRALRCGAGTASRIASRSDPSRSARPAKARRTSLCEGSVCTTAYPRSAARLAATRSRVVFPAPAGPATTSARAADGRAARNSSSLLSSASRPNTASDIPGS